MMSVNYELEMLTVNVTVTDEPSFGFTGFLQKWRPFRPTGGFPEFDFLELSPAVRRVVKKISDRPFRTKRCEN